MIKKFRLIYNKWSPTNKIFFYLAILGIVLAIVFGVPALSQKETVIQDNDLIDNKGANNPITNIYWNNEPERELTENDKNYINSQIELYQAKSVALVYNANDKNARNLALNIQPYLESQGISIVLDPRYGPMGFEGLDFMNGSKAPRWIKVDMGLLIGDS